LKIIDGKARILVDPVIDGAGAVGAVGQRVAVGFGAGDSGRADIAAGTGTVLDDDSLVQCPGQGVGVNATQGVSAAAGCKRHHHGNGAIGVGVGLGGCNSA